MRDKRKEECKEKVERKEGTEEGGEKRRMCDREETEK